MSVRKNPTTGLWEADFRVNGRRFREKKFLSREDARNFENMAKASGRLGVDVSSTFAKPLDEGIEEYVRLETSKKESAADEKSFLREFYRYLVFEEKLSTFPEVQLIHFSRYQKFLANGVARNELQKKAEAAKRKALRAAGKESEYTPPRKIPLRSLSASAINRHFNSIGDLFTWAKRWKWVSTNEIIDLEILPETSVKRKLWKNSAKIQEAIDVASAWARGPFFLIAQTGIRPVGCKRLSWSDVDFNSRAFKVLSKKGRGGEMREHWVPMTESVYDFFNQLWRERSVGKYGHLVFHSATGEPLKTKMLSKEMARVTKKIGMTGHVLYGFRHEIGTAVTNPSKDGLRSGNIEVARQVMGHSSLEQTKDYVHTEMETVRNQLEMLNNERKIVFRRKEG